MFYEMCFVAQDRILSQSYNSSQSMKFEIAHCSTLGTTTHVSSSSSHLTPHTLLAAARYNDKFRLLDMNSRVFVDGYYQNIIKIYNINI